MGPKKGEHEGGGVEPTDVPFPHKTEKEGIKLREIESVEKK